MLDLIFKSKTPYGIDFSVYDGEFEVGVITKKDDSFYFKVFFSPCLYSKERFSTLIKARYEFSKMYYSKKHDANFSKKTENINYICAKNNPNFYPTPSKLAALMFSKINWRNIKTVLEPSAGKGDILDCMMKYYYRRDYLEIDCIENDVNLQYILNGKGYNVVFDDFLNFVGNKYYDLIIMNPPFSEGSKHLLKAISLQETLGGQICCVLNAETLQNPYTNERKSLVNKLSQYKAEILYVENAFKKAERVSDVKVAVIWLDIPQKAETSFIFENLKKAEFEKDEVKDITDICSSDVIDGLVARFNFEVKLCKRFFSEFRAIEPYLRGSFDEKENRYKEPIMSIKCGKNNTVNDCLKLLRIKYWHAFLTNKDIIGKFTRSLQDIFYSIESDMKNYDFNKFNIERVLKRMNAELFNGVESTALNLFEKFTVKHAWYPECQNNIHYFDGWQTNKAYKIGKKVIFPYYAFDRYSYEELADIEKVFNYFDGHATEGVSIETIVDKALKNGITKNIKCKYFNVTFYKKGTCHIKFHEEFEYLIDAFNIFVCKNKRWLPPSYAKVSYDEMTASERAIIDSFQGKEEYQKVMDNSHLYLRSFDFENIKLLSV